MMRFARHRKPAAMSLTGWLVYKCIRSSSSLLFPFLNLTLRNPSVVLRLPIGKSPTLTGARIILASHSSLPYPTASKDWIPARLAIFTYHTSCDPALADDSYFNSLPSPLFSFLDSQPLRPLFTILLELPLDSRLNFVSTFPRGLFPTTSTLHPLYPLLEGFLRR